MFLLNPTILQAPSSCQLKVGEHAGDEAPGPCTAVRRMGTALDSPAPHSILQPAVSTLMGARVQQASPPLASHTQQEHVASPTTTTSESKVPLDSGPASPVLHPRAELRFHNTNPHCPEMEPSTLQAPERSVAFILKV